MDKVQKTTFTDYNTPSSEPFRLHLLSHDLPKGTEENHKQPKSE
jgi:hypothetical protein